MGATLGDIRPALVSCETKIGMAIPLPYPEASGSAHGASPCEVMSSSYITAWCVFFMGTLAKWNPRLRAISMTSGLSS